MLEFHSRAKGRSAVRTLRYRTAFAHLRHAADSIGFTEPFSPPATAATAAATSSSFAADSAYVTLLEYRGKRDELTIHINALNELRVLMAWPERLMDRVWLNEHWKGGYGDWTEEQSNGEMQDGSDPRDKIEYAIWELGRGVSFPGDDDRARLCYFVFDDALAALIAGFTADLWRIVCAYAADTTGERVVMNANNVVPKTASGSGKASGGSVSSDGGSDADDETASSKPAET